MKIKTKRGSRRIRNQRVRDKRFVVTDYDKCPHYITAGKWYKTVLEDGLITKHITNDQGRNNTIYIGSAGCAHLDSIGTWYHPIR